MGHHAISIESHTFNVRSGNYDRFWNRVNRGQWEPSTYAFFQDNIDSSTLLVDFGAWIGSTAFFGAQLAGQTVAFEPDRRAFEELQANLGLNQSAPWARKIQIFNEAIHQSGAPLLLHSGTETGGDSMSSALSINRPNSISVKSRRLQTVVEAFRGSAAKVFIKMDIEGGEYSMLPTVADMLEDPDVTFLIEFHHRQFFRSFKAAASDALDWKQDYKNALSAMMDVMPVEREFQIHPGQLAEREEVEAVILGKAKTDSVLIR